MNDDILTLYYYDEELSARERREVEAALESDPGLSTRYERLCADLEQLKPAEDASAPEHLAARWHDAIDRAAAKEAAPAPAQRRSRSGVFFLGFAVAASMAIGIAIGIFLTNGSAPVETTSTVVADDNSAALSRGLAAHFRDSRDALAVSDLGSASERTQLIMNIVQQNRLFERMATRNDAADLARVLRAIEPVLIELAAEDISPEEAVKLQSQIAFELSVVLTKLARQVSDQSDDIET